MRDPAVYRLGSDKKHRRNGLWAIRTIRISLFCRRQWQIQHPFMRHVRVAFGMKPWHRAVQDAFGVLTGTLEETAGNSGTECESAADGQKKMLERKITITDYDYGKKNL